MKIKQTVLAIALLVLTASVYAAPPKVYEIPEEYQILYPETVTVPGASADEILYKIQLFLIDQNYLWYLEASNPTSYGEFPTYYTLIKNDAMIEFEGVSRLVYGFLQQGFGFPQIVGHGQDAIKKIGLSADVAGTGAVFLIITEEQYHIHVYRESFLAKNDKEADNYIKRRINNPKCDAAWLPAAEKLKRGVLAEPLSNDEYNELMQKGREAYSKSTVRSLHQAREYFYQAAMANPENPEALISYGNCFAQLGRIRTGKKENGWPSYGWYTAAIAVYSLLPNNPVAQNNITICQTLRDRARKNEQIKRQQFEASMAALSAFGEGLQNIASQGQGQSGGGNSGGQSQAEASNDSSSRGNMANNPDAARRTYSNYVRAAKGHYNNLQKAYRQNNATATQSDKDRVKQLERSLEDTQNKMRDFRERANQQGVNIRADHYETAWPRG